MYVTELSIRDYSAYASSLGYKSGRYEWFMGVGAMGQRETMGNRMGRAEALSWKYEEMGMG